VDPATYAATRLSVHRLACYVIGPAAGAASARDAPTLIPVAGGVGTPPFGPDHIVLRIDGMDLVREVDSGTSRRPITTLNDAGSLAGIAPDVSLQDRLDVPPAGDLDAVLPVDDAASRLLGAWLGDAFAVLGDIADAAPPAEEPTRPRLWTEHFDAAIDLGAGQRRGTYGASPGDHNHPTPYLYATIWAGVPDDPFYDAVGFRGAWLRFEDVDTGDRRQAARAFFDEAIERARRL
jgi:hypothetical protein